MQRLKLALPVIVAILAVSSSVAFAQYGGEQLPKQVPASLTAQQYYDLGVNYKLAGWTELSRQSLLAAVKLDPNGTIGKMAQKYSRTKLPAYPVADKAVQMNVQAFNLNVQGQKVEAQQLWETTIQEYPNFEWPYSNLASLLLEKHELAKAEQLAKQATKLNPYYLNAWLVVESCKLETQDLAGAKAIVEQIHKIDSDDDRADALLNYYSRDVHI